eukprot:COSAG02_NODE_3787_length_6232_cov_22.002120_2_plen_214_part_00
MAPSLLYAELSCMRARAVAHDLADHRIVLYDKLLQQPAALQELITTSYTALQLQMPANAERYAQMQLCMEEAFHDVAPITLSREMRYLRNADNEAIMLHAYNGPSVVGGATLKTMRDQPAAELMLLAVRSEHSGRGFANRLLQAVDRLGLERGWRQLFLMTKPVARGFYEQHGFRLPAADEQMAYSRHIMDDQLQSEVLHQFYYEVLTLVNGD